MDDDREPPEEERIVYRRRYQEAREAGLTIAEATMFAESHEDIGLLRKLVAGSCAPERIARILI